MPTRPEGPPGGPAGPPAGGAIGAETGAETGPGPVEPHRPERRRWPLVLAAVLGALLVAVTAAGVAGLSAVRQIDRPTDPAGAERTFEIHPGTPVQTVARELERDGLIGDARLFLLLARYEKSDRAIRAGRYRLSPALPPREILARLARGEVLQVRVTIPEGFTLAQIAARLDAAGLADERAFLAAAADPVWLRELGIPSPDLEGYLFPDTYHFAHGLAPAAIARTMVERHRAVFTAEVAPHLEAAGLGPHEAVTLASIIEKESSVESEKPAIAAVFHNRLGRGMRLETDPTVIYGLEDFDGNLTREHLRTPTPYNTYVIRGLPPGPIANPGRDSLVAAVRPAEASCLFFVARNDGTHWFSETYAEHRRAVRRYQLQRRRDAGADAAPGGPCLHGSP